MEFHEKKLKPTENICFQNVLIVYQQLFFWQLSYGDGSYFRPTLNLFQIFLNMLKNLDYQIKIFATCFEMSRNGENLNKKNVNVYVADFSNLQFLESLKNDSFDWIIFSHALTFIFETNIQNAS